MWQIVMLPLPGNPIDLNPVTCKPCSCPIKLPWAPVNPHPVHPVQTTIRLVNWDSCALTKTLLDGQVSGLFVYIHQAISDPINSI